MSEGEYGGGHMEQTKKVDSQFRLYKKQYGSAASFSEDVKCFRPTLLKGLFIRGEEKYWKTALSRLYFWAISAGRLEVYYIIQKEKVVHTSYVVPVCYKFPFMKRGDYEIGPCQTEEACRGQGMYVRTLNHITSQKRYENACFYMLVSESNASSIRGIEKAGFVEDGYAVRSGWLKRYVKVNV